MGEQPTTDQGHQPVAPEEDRSTTVFAPRIPTSMRRDIDAIQGLTGQNVNEVGVEALTLWMEAKLADESLGAKLEAELDAEQKKLDQRRANLSGILGRRAAGNAAQDEAASGRATAKQSKAPSSSENAS